MNITASVDLIRLAASKALDPKKRGSLGQFFTPAPICQFMASLFDTLEGDIRVLDPGSGSGALSAAIVSEAVRRNTTSKVDISTYDIEDTIKPYLAETMKYASATALRHGVEVTHQHHDSDFVLTASDHFALGELGRMDGRFTHVIMNPPYKKIASNGEHRRALRAAGIETVNLYAGFVALAVLMLKTGGELVAIIPRSFCNGPYYQPFRELLVREMSLRGIHLFESRNKAFAEADVLQENIILHCVKGKPQGQVTITSSPVADFHIDEESKSISATDMTTRTVPFSKIVNPSDKQQFIHIAANERDQAVIDHLSVFSTSLPELGINVATGPVVDFRLKDDLRPEFEDDCAPLLYPIHLNGKVSWPLASKKPNAIAISDASRPWLWKQGGHFVAVRRFSSKEEKRRICATVYDSSLPGALIGFDNKLNVFHANKCGFDPFLARGLNIFLNCSLLDQYYRLFGGHTQVNATDLRSIQYPSRESLRRMGEQANSDELTQRQIDDLIDSEIKFMTGNNDNSPLAAREKIGQALEILAALGMPRAQQSERSALTLLALLNLHPDTNWQDIERPMIGVTPIMEWCKEVYGKEYAPNTRETFRRQTLHQFVDGGLCLYNPDEPTRPVNSPRACYQITPELFEVIATYDTPDWPKTLAGFLEKRPTLAQQYAAERDMAMIPLTLPDGSEIKLSAGAHSQLIKDIVIEFGPRFAPGSEVIYLGDTGAKEDFFNIPRLKELGVVVDRKGKLPDVVMYWPERDWLLLVESVTSHGPVDGKRHGELKQLFVDARPGLVFVTAFPDRRTMTKHLADISWETEVWVAEAPTHMIHFNGVRFLGPYPTEE